MILASGNFLGWYRLPSNHSNHGRRPLILVLYLYFVISFQNEGAIPLPSAIARCYRSSQWIEGGNSRPFAMRPLDRRLVAHNVHQWNKDRSVDQQPNQFIAEEMAVICRCCGVSSPSESASMGKTSGDATNADFTM